MSFCVRSGRECLLQQYRRILNDPGWQQIKVRSTIITPVRYRHRILFLDVLQRWLETTDLSGEQARTFPLVTLHMALHHKPKGERPGCKLCPAIECLDCHWLIVIKNLKITFLQCFFRESVLSVPGDHIHQDEIG